MRSAGTRYIQAALGTASERKRRLPSLSFQHPGDDASEAAGSAAAAADAVGGRLPLLIYESAAGSSADSQAAAERRRAENAEQEGHSPVATGEEWLRHGRVCAHGLRARLSTYYEENERDPTIVEPRMFKGRRRLGNVEAARKA